MLDVETETPEVPYGTSSFITVFLSLKILSASILFYREDDVLLVSLGSSFVTLVQVVLRQEEDRASTRITVTAQLKFLKSVVIKSLIMKSAKVSNSGFGFVLRHAVTAVFNRAG